jgi:farnesyl diphosphate synthase
MEGSHLAASSIGERLRLSEAWVNTGLSGLFDSFGEASWSVLPGDGRYTVEAGGKRVRPFLVRTACEACRMNPAPALPAAMSVELVHAYSLVHDDLPCMDNDDLRRGVPTLHVRSGVAPAVLAADWLLVLAFDVLLSSSFSPSTVSRMTAHLARAAGPSWLVAGQFRDLSPPDSPGMDWIELVQGGKTAAMIRVSLELGAIAGTAAGGDFPEPVSDLGYDLGVLFQITDDMLDVTSSTEELGKRAGKDMDQGKATHVTVLGLSGARAVAEELRDRILQQCNELPGDWDAIADLAEYLLERKR